MSDLYRAAAQVYFYVDLCLRKTFEKITGDARKRLKHAKRSLDDNQDRIRRWKKREFWGDETPANKREHQEMLKEAEEEAEQLPPG